MLMPKFMGYSKSSFKRDFSQKMLTGLGEFPGEARGEGWWRLQLTLGTESTGGSHPWSSPHHVDTVAGGHHALQLSFMLYLNV